MSFHTMMNCTMFIYLIAIRHHNILLPFHCKTTGRSLYCEEVINNKKKN